MFSSDVAKTIQGYTDDEVWHVFKRARYKKSSADVLVHHLSAMELKKRGIRVAPRHTTPVEVERVTLRSEDLPDDMGKSVALPDVVDMVTLVTPEEFQIVIEPIDDDLWQFETPFEDNEGGGYEEARKAAGVKVGDYVMCSDDNSIRGRVEHIMTTGSLGWEGSPMAIEASPSDPAVLVRIFEERNGTWRETDTFTGRPQSKVILLDSIEKAKRKIDVGDFVSWNTSGGRARGEVIRIVKTGEIDVPDSSFTITAEEDDPAVLIRLWRTTSQGNAPTGTQVGHKMSTLRRIEPLKETLEKRIAQENGEWCVYAETTGRSFGCYNTKEEAEERLAQIEMFKADTPDSFSPPTGVRAAARRAIGWIEDGKAGSGFTATGRRRASQLAGGESVSLDTIRRMRSYFARHTPDKDATGFSSGEEGFPSAGRVAWDAWGGDAGKSWADRIYQRYAADKAYEETPTTFFKSADEERRYTMGPMYIPNSVDAQNEWTDEEELQSAVWEYVRGGDRRIRLQHNRDIVAGEWVEVLTWPFEVSVPMMSLDQTVNKVETMTFPKNTVFLGVVWEPWAWDLVKKGLLRGYSIGGNAARVMADLPEA